MSWIIIGIRSIQTLYKSTAAMTIKNQIITTISILFLLGIALFLSQTYEWRIIDSLRVGAGSIWLLFIPWYWLVSTWFKNDDIDILEIIALSFAFSISVIPLLVFYLNLIGLPIDQWLVYSTVVIITIIGIIREQKTKIQEIL